jgi:hypothetical protein
MGDVWLWLALAALGLSAGLNLLLFETARRLARWHNERDDVVQRQLDIIHEQRREIRRLYEARDGRTPAPDPPTYPPP